MQDELFRIAAAPPCLMDSTHFFSMRSHAVTKGKGLMRSREKKLAMLFRTTLLAGLLASCVNERQPPPATALDAPSASPAPAAVQPPRAQTNVAAAPASPTSRTSDASALSPSIDEAAVAAATGVDKPERSADGVVKASFPRKDVPVTVDGWKMPPFMGLTSWVAFSPGRQGVAEAMIMGDLVLFEDEVNPVMSVLLESGVEVTALHNHFFFDAPNVYFLHVGGEGTVAALGGAVKAAMGSIDEIRKRRARPAQTFGAPILPAKSSIDSAKVEAILGVKGQTKDGMFKATIGRKAKASCGCLVGKTMGVNTWAAFGGTDQNAVVDGDFAVVEAELQAVLKALRSGGINVVAIHHHMSGETPRILFLHYWGRGKAADLAATLKKALDLTDFDKTSA